jgi:hypothetical protein
MKDLAAPFRELVERRLWPLAVLLLAALVAVPFLLASSSDDAVPGPTASATDAQGETQPIVSLAEAADREQDRKVLGSAKNPFRPAIAAKAAQVVTESAAATASGGSSTGGAASSDSAGSGGTSTGGGSSTPSTDTPPTPVTPGDPAPTYQLFSLLVRFGETSGEPRLRNLPRLKGLPGGASPKLIYLGLLTDHKTAVFLVDASAQVRGDGKCQPSPDDCHTLRMKAGDTAFIDMPGGKQYELDVVRIISSRTTSRTVAAQARASVAPGGREALRKHIDRVGPYRYSSSSGTVKVLPGAGWKSAPKTDAGAKPKSGRGGSRSLGAWASSDAG